MSTYGTNIEKFIEAWEKQLTEIEEEVVIPAQAKFAGMLLVNLQQFSPQYSGYYASNHRIVLKGNTFKLHPPQRRADEEQDVYVGNIAASRAQELAKLEDRQALKGVVNIKVGTAVRYATDPSAVLYLPKPVEDVYHTYMRALRVTLAQYKVTVTGRIK